MEIFLDQLQLIQRFCGRSSARSDCANESFTAIDAAVTVSSTSIWRIRQRQETIRGGTNRDARDQVSAAQGHLPKQGCFFFTRASATNQSTAEQRHHFPSDDAELRNLIAFFLTVDLLDDLFDGC